MDTTTVPGLAGALGISLPRTHRLLDRLEVPRSAGRGVGRVVPVWAFDRAVRLIGSVPLRPDGFTREQVLGARALVCTIPGVGSGRELARLIAVSPTTATAVLGELASRGLVRTSRSVVADAGRALVRDLWEPDALASWPEDLLRAVGAARLPTPVDGTGDRVPRRFWHQFWNVDPSTLRLSTDGPFVAARLLDAQSAAATGWVLHHVACDDIDAAVARRGVPARTRAIAGLA